MKNFHKFALKILGLCLVMFGLMVIFATIPKPGIWMWLLNRGSGVVNILMGLYYLRAKEIY